MVFTDPPYNVPIDGHVSRPRRGQAPRVRDGLRRDDEAEFTAFLSDVFANLAAHADRRRDPLRVHGLAPHGRGPGRGQPHYTELKNLCVWAKTNGGMGSLYRSQHELVFVFKSGHGAAHQQRRARQARPLPHERLVLCRRQHLQRDARDDLAMHPTVKPVALVADAILDCSRRKGIILDAFGGSGTTLVAAERRAGAAMASNSIRTTAMSSLGVCRRSWGTMLCTLAPGRRLWKWLLKSAQPPP